MQGLVPRGWAPTNDLEGRNVPLDIYSKMLILVDFLALLLLLRYLDSQFMWVPFGLLMILLWVWLYRLLSPLSFGISGGISVVGAVALYLPNQYARTICVAVLVPSIASAFRRIASEPSKPTV